MKHSPILLLTGLLAGGGLTAQTRTLLFSTTAVETSANAIGLEVASFRAGEVQQFVPGSDFGARPFLSDGCQWVFIGDANGNARIVDDATNGPGQFTDAIFVRRFGTGSGESSPRTVWLSKSSTTGFSSSLEDGSVFRYNSQNQTEVFVTEAALLQALGQAPNLDLDLDAICQDAQGNLYMSFESTESVNGTNALDGAIIRIPRAAITYNLFNGTVSNIASGSAQILVDESVIAGFITNSGVQTATGSNPSTNVNLSGLEIDPNGGTFSTAFGNVPNLIFTWTASTNDGAILSTRNMGQIATINGVPMGSTTQTIGTHIGLTPDTSGVDGLSGLALLNGNRTPDVVTEIGPSNLLFPSSVLFVRQEITGLTPNGLAGAFVDFAAGGQFPSFQFPPVIGEFYGLGNPTVLATLTADSNGYATFQLVVPPSTFVSGQRFTLGFQALDFGTLRTALPAALQIN